MSRKRKKTHSANLNFCPCTDFSELWVLRILIQLDGWRKLGSSQNSYTSNGAVLKAISLGHLEDENISKAEFLHTIKDRQKEVEARELNIDPTISQNFDLLSQEIELNATEIQLLLFSLVLSLDERLKEVTNCMGELTAESILYILSVILDEKIDDIRRALSPNGMLKKSGILSLERDYAGELSDRLELFDGFPILLEPHNDISSILSKFFKPVSSGTLMPEDYSYLQKEFNLAVNYLKFALETFSPNINILLHGPPGTGKTELAKTIANTLSIEMYEVIATNTYDESMEASRRISAYQLAQHILGRRGNRLLLFDEVEDVLEHKSFNIFSFTYKDHPSKAAINKLLENNPVPTIWIVNNIDDIDNAVLRRFDIVLHINYPPRSTRSKIIYKYLNGLPLEKEWVNSVAENKLISPGIISRASKVVNSLNHSHVNNVKKDIELLIENALTAMGHNILITNNSKSDVPYCLEAINSDTNLSTLMKGLKRTHEARLCLYGPSGTGKTEFCHHLARFLDKQLIAKGASDILDPFVGGTETNIALMFSEAKREDAVLLLDEADSFLQNRSHARNRWEITQVNELLTQMEAFQGIFICSTNLIGTMDAASIRRFDLKIKFDYLNPEQIWMLFDNLFHEQSVKDESYKWKSKLTQLKHVTPGDFSLAIRQNQISNSSLTPKCIFESLARESSFKNSSQDKRIGFITN